MWRYALFPLIAVLAGCGQKSDAVDDFRTTKIKLPDGAVIRAEVMRRPEDMMRGMMFRDSLPEDRGMLFIHGKPGKYTYYMYQVKIPLDIIWMDGRNNVVEVSANAPPCTTNASACPTYGGTKDALLVLELAGGAARKHGVVPGARLEF